VKRVASKTAIPSVGKKAFIARRFGAGFDSGLGSGVGFVVSIFTKKFNKNNEIQNHYNAFTVSAQKSCWSEKL
jgi:hypothetical protein